MLVRGKYGAEFREQAGRLVLSPTEDSDFLESSISLGLAVLWQTLKSEDISGFAQAANEFVSMLHSPRELTRCEGATGLEQLCNILGSNGEAKRGALEGSFQCARLALTPLLEGRPAECLSALWALMKLGQYCRLTLPEDLDLLERLCGLLKDSPPKMVREIAIMAIAAQPLVPRSECWQDVSFTLEESDARFESGDSSRRAASLVIAWYTRSFTDAGIALRIQLYFKQARGPYDARLYEILRHLGQEP